MECIEIQGDTAAMEHSSKASPFVATALVADAASELLPVDVHFAGRERDPSLAGFAAVRIGKALARFHRRVKAVRVQVRDVNARRGGIDQLCSIEVALADGERLYLSEAAEHAGRALLRLTRRVRRLIADRRHRRGA